MGEVVEQVKYTVILNKGKEMSLTRMETEKDSAFKQFQKEVMQGGEAHIVFQEGAIKVSSIDFISKPRKRLSKEVLSDSISSQEHKLKNNLKVPTDVGVFEDATEHFEALIREHEGGAKNG